MGDVSDERPKVVSLRGGTILPPGEPRPHIVKMAEQILERARSGDLMGLSVVMHHADDTHSHWHEGRVVYATVGCLEVLKTHLAHDI